MILLTGATGYIGSHIWAALLKKGLPVVGLDNLSNSSEEVLNAVKSISKKPLVFIKGDIRDLEVLKDLFSNHPITHVIHLAALKDASESMERQSEYYDVNVRGLGALLQVMRAHECYKLIFSSSAAVYGGSALAPIDEFSELSPSNYYGETKVAGERLLANEYLKSPAMSSISLRYFNVAGRDSSGPLHGDSSSSSQSLFSEIRSVLQGKKRSLNVYGKDWESKDGTCIRDYLHVDDVVQGHIDSLNLLDKGNGFYILNLGLGIGQSVFEVIAACEKISGRVIPKEVINRRLGDVGISFANINLAKKTINWRPQKSLTDICRDSID